MDQDQERRLDAIERHIRSIDLGVATIAFVAVLGAAIACGNLTYWNTVSQWGPSWATAAGIAAVAVVLGLVKVVVRQISRSG